MNPLNEPLPDGPEWVLAEKFCDLTGNTANAVHQRRKKGQWLDGTHTAVVNRRLYVNIKAADQWIKSQVQPRQPHRPA